MTLAMMCEECQGRWVALTLGTTLKGDRASYHFARSSLQCPRCGSVGIIDSDTLGQHQKHPQVVATNLGSVRK